jgi:hypothetical protein
MTTPRRPNQPVSFEEAQRIIGSQPGQETTPDPAETVAPENLGQCGFESHWGHTVCAGQGTAWRLVRPSVDGWGRREAAADRAPPSRASAITPNLSG